MESSVLNATGLTRLCGAYQKKSRHKTPRRTHYPSTPASNARRLSSSDDIPVNARMRLGCDRELFSFLRKDSICRICVVAPTPSKIGIDRSKSTTLARRTYQRQHPHNEGDGGGEEIRLTRSNHPSRKSARLLARPRPRGTHIPATIAPLAPPRPRPNARCV